VIPGHVKSTILAALMQHRGDDVERARRAFQGYGTEDMKKQHGQSGRTRAEILAEYEEHAANVEAARAWVESQ
jgi:hypothetical protein